MIPYFFVQIIINFFINHTSKLKHNEVIQRLISSTGSCLAQTSLPHIWNKPCPSNPFQACLHSYRAPVKICLHIQLKNHSTDFMTSNTEELLHPFQFWLEWDTHSTHLTWSISSIHRPTDHPKQNTKESLDYTEKGFVCITLYSNITRSITLPSYHKTQVFPYTSSSPTVGINSKSPARIWRKCVVCIG